MCKRMTVAYGEYIGNRHVAWCLFNGKDYSFLSDKQVKTRLQAGDLVNGLMLDADSNVCINKEFTKTVMGKSGLSFSPITANDGEDELVMNKYYALVKVEQSKGGKLYHFITNRCGHEVFDEGQLKAMVAVLEMGGVQLDSKGNLVVHKDVDVDGVGVTSGKATGDTKGTDGVAK